MGNSLRWRPDFFTDVPDLAALDAVSAIVRSRLPSSPTSPVGCHPSADIVKLATDRMVHAVGIGPYRYSFDEVPDRGRRLNRGRHTVKDASNHL